MRGYVGGKQPVDIDQVRKMVSSSGALEEAKRISRDNAEAASELLRKAGMRPESREFFLSFIGYVKESLEWYK